MPARRRRASAWDTSGADGPIGLRPTPQPAKTSPAQAPPAANELAAGEARGAHRTTKVPSITEGWTSQWNT